MALAERYYAIKETIPSDVKIVAVSKTKPVSMIQELFLKTGHTVFGENKAREMELKQTMLPTGIHWHFIGHLQTNKIKYIAPFVSLIHSVDSFRLLSEINKEAIKCGRVIPCLLQFHIAKEEAKFGFSVDEVNKMLDSNEFQQLSNISLKGVMGMATFTSDQQIIRSEFQALVKCFNELKSRNFSSQPDFCEISMGMTEDYLIAVEEGSTMIRIGSAIFGER